MPNYQTNPNGPALIVPTREEIDNLQVGDLAIDCFGKMSRVVRIAFRGTDLNGRAYVGYNTDLGPGSTISQSIKEGELVRTLATSRDHTSTALDAIERRINQERIETAFVEDVATGSIELPAL